MVTTVHRAIIVSALEREIQPLVDGWRRHDALAHNRRVRLFESDRAIVAYAGIGVSSARVAADVAFRHAGNQASVMVSAGLAGALNPDLRIADIVQPSEVLDDVDGITIPTAAGEGTLLTAGVVADKRLKEVFAKKHVARAVDMEAFAVADVARIYGVPFLAVKSISDEYAFEMPPLNRYITDRGGFRTAAFIGHALLRPWSWANLVRLGKNTDAAIGSLTPALQKVIQQAASGLYNRDKSRVEP